MKVSQSFVSLGVGFLFAMGLGISSMTQPGKVIGFLDFAHWDPSLIFVMMGAVGIHALSYFFIKKRATPLLDTRWHFTSRRDLNARLILGSALFGLGWGLGGFCPGPALVSLVTGEFKVWIFFISMIAGMAFYKVIEKKLPLNQ